MAELVAARLSSIRSDSLTRFWIINKNNNELDRCGGELEDGTGA